MQSSIKTRKQNLKLRKLLALYVTKLQMLKKDLNNYHMKVKVFKKFENLSINNQEEKTCNSNIKVVSWLR